MKFNDVCHLHLTNYSEDIGEINSPYIEKYYEDGHLSDVISLFRDLMKDGGYELSLKAKLFIALLKFCSAIFTILVVLFFTLVAFIMCLLPLILGHYIFTLFGFYIELQLGILLVLLFSTRKYLANIVEYSAVFVATFVYPFYEMYKFIRGDKIAAIFKKMCIESFAEEVDMNEFRKNYLCEYILTAKRRFTKQKYASEYIVFECYRDVSMWSNQPLGSDVSMWYNQPLYIGFSPHIVDKLSQTEEIIDCFGKKGLLAVPEDVALSISNPFPIPWKLIHCISIFVIIVTFITVYLSIQYGGFDISNIISGDFYKAHNSF